MNTHRIHDLARLAQSCWRVTKKVWPQSYGLPLAALREGVVFTPRSNSLLGRVEESGNLHVSLQAEGFFDLPLRDVHGDSKSFFTEERQPYFTLAGQSSLT